MTFENILKVYSYLFQVDASSYTINTSEGLKIGYLGWSTITGDAQRLLGGIKPSTDVEKLIHERYFLAETKAAVKWVSAAPVSYASAFAPEYSAVFTKLIKDSEKAQLAEIKSQLVVGKKYAESLGLKEPNQIILAALRMLVDPISYEQLSIIAAKDDKLSEMAGDSTRLSCLLSPVKRYLPNQDIDLVTEFPWLFVNPNVDES